MYYWAVVPAEYSDADATPVPVSPENAPRGPPVSGPEGPCLSSGEAAEVWTVVENLRASAEYAF